LANCGLKKWEIGELGIREFAIEKLGIVNWGVIPLYHIIKN